jgi:hypothetical protein
MTKSLRTLSPRPQLIVPLVADPAAAQLGVTATPLGRNRLVAALPLRDGPVTLVSPSVFVAPDGSYLADPDDALLGNPGIKVDRLLAARRTLDTRRL